MFESIGKFVFLGVIVPLIACGISNDEIILNNEIQAKKVLVQDNSDDFQKVTEILSDNNVEFEKLTKYIESNDVYALCKDKQRNITFDISNEVMSEFYYQYGFFKGVLSYLNSEGKLVHTTFKRTERGTFSAAAKNMGAYREDGENLRFFWSVCLEGNLDAPSICLKRFPSWENCREKDVTKILTYSFLKSQTPE